MNNFHSSTVCVNVNPFHVHLQEKQEMILVGQELIVMHSVLSDICQ